MIAFSLEWHKECLKNHQRTVADERERVARMQKALETSEKELAFYTLQVEMAEKKGKKSFDTDRFMKKERAEFFA